MLSIRLAEKKDMEQILALYCAARKYMAENGNPSQWGNSYPEQELLEEDIAKEQLYFCEENGGAVGVFAFMTGEDPTYQVIEDGAWLNEEPYGTIHRIAGNGKYKGLAAACFDFCSGLAENLRADTHRDNRIMQHCLEKYGFVRCGTIYVRDRSPRVAYQYVNHPAP